MWLFMADKIVRNFGVFEISMYFNITLQNSGWSANKANTIKFFLWNFALFFEHFDTFF